ncbi:MAG TPA: hypothetical protein VHP83_10725 [Aggregatilineaceae bacterium]|nr:hypothetical protein [Aggregatilineaceae bacterium]
MADTLTPRYKLMLLYDLIPGDSEEYYQFIMSELTPALQQQGLHLFQVFHTVWGSCPVRQAEFVAEDLNTVEQFLRTETWLQLEAKLRQHSTNYSRKVVRFRPGFQL